MNTEKLKHTLILLAMILLTSCSVTIVFAPKEVIVKDGTNTIEIKGSDLEGNNMDQSADGSDSIPLPIP